MKLRSEIAKCRSFREVTRLDTLRIAASGITGLDERSFSTGRSVVLGLAIGGAAAAFALTALGFEGGGSNLHQVQTDHSPVFFYLRSAAIGALIHW
ncbi:MAG: hypothetical protein Ct9H300mP15_15610 [Gemmatimonadota bacterium]|nr:MAG: hypothetical protein Ct9H300mP15_15610 [Gemmatimonadota bacterium]